jgi:hypothetical protein
MEGRGGHVNITEEKPISLSRAARMIPSGRGENVCPTTIWRWSRRGLCTPSGARIFLETRRYGQHVCTTAEALARFLAALNGEAVPDVAPARDLHEEDQARRNVKVDAAGKPISRKARRVRVTKSKD